MRNRIEEYRERVRDGIEAAFANEHTPHEIAASFALGTVITALPTGGTALVLFVLVAYFVDRASKLALLATLAVFNPVVKWSVYAASFWLGSRLLGPVPGVTPTTVEFSLSAGSALLTRWLLGNAILALALAAVGYGLVLLAVRAYRRHEPADAIAEAVAE